MKRTNFVLAACLLLLLTMIFTGCGGTEPQEASETSKIVVGIPQDFDSLDPHISQASGTEEIMFNIFTGLVMPSTDGELIPALAERWEINEDSSSFTFI